MTAPTPPPFNLRPGKFVIPARLPGLLRRPRLLDFLSENLHRRLILVSAAAGYGKSSLLVDFARETDKARAAWYQLDPADADLAVFAAGLASAWRRVYPAFDSLLPSLASQPGAKAGELANAFNREMDIAFDENCLLVLDDFHLVGDSPAVAAFLDALLANLPEQVHVIISGRAAPPLRVSALAARQQVAALDEAQLRFTAEEVRQLARARGQAGLSQAEAEALAAEAEGWITGIVLRTQLLEAGALPAALRAARARRRSPSGEAEGPVYDFLAAEVLDQQPENLKQFLMESAVLTEAEPGACDAVLERTDSAALLREAEARRLFISPVGDQTGTYRYHHLFQEFLVAQLRAADPGRLRALQLRAAEWCEANNLSDEAVTFYISAGELAKAASIAERNADQMHVTGRLTTMQRWFDQLSPVVRDAPRLCFYLAKLQSDFDMKLAERTCVLAIEGFTHRGDEAGLLAAEVTKAGWAYDRGDIQTCLIMAETYLPLTRDQGLVRDECHTLRLLGLCYSRLGNLDKAEEFFEQAIQILRGTPHRFGLAFLLNNLANLLRMRGQTSRLAQVQQELMAIWREVGAPGRLATALNNAGYDQHMLGQYESALATYREALECARKGGVVRAEVLILQGQGDLFADLGDASAAADLYQQALAKVEKLEDKALVSHLYRGMAELNRSAGNFAAALEWLRRAEECAGQLKIPFLNVAGLRGITLVEMGRVAEGRDVLERACADTWGAVSDLSQNFFFLACAQFREGDLEKAAGSLEQAFRLADQLGYDQMLLAEASAARDLLEAAVARTVVGETRSYDLGVRAAGLLRRAEGLSAVRERLAGALPYPAVKVCALGEMQTLVEGAPVASWGARQARDLFYFLVDRGGAAREDILEAFWPEMDSERALRNFKPTLHRLRQAAGRSLIVYDDGVYRLTPEVRWRYDAAAFQAAAEKALGVKGKAGESLGTRPDYAGAAALYTGEFLPEVESPWAQARRGQLRALYIRLMREYAAASMALGDYALAHPLLSRALAVDALNDDLNELMLRCLGELGWRHKLSEHYDQYRQCLAEALGLDPPAKLRALYDELLGG